MKRSDTRHNRIPHRRLTPMGVPATLSLGLIATGCNIPLDVPQFLTEWQFVGVDETILTEELLPLQIRLANEVFRVDSVSSSRTVTIGEVCELCTCFAGPIPEVDITPQDFTIPIPGGLSSAVMVGGAASLVLHNEMEFDLLNDGKGNQGFIAVELKNSLFDEVLDEVRLEEPFPPGDSLELTFDLTGLELNPFLIASVRGTTPGTACDSISIDLDDGIRADVDLRNVAATEVNIFLSDQAIRFPLKNIELPSPVADRLRPGDARIVLEVEIETSVEVDVEVLLSAAGLFQDLFTRRAALFTPIPVPPGSLENPTVVRKVFLLDLTSIEGAENLHIATQNRVLGSRRVLIRGGEEVKYKATIRAEVPSN